MSSIALPDFFFLDLDFLTLVVSFARGGAPTSSALLEGFEDFFSLIVGEDSTSFSSKGSTARRIGTPKSLSMSSTCVFAVKDNAFFCLTERSRRGRDVKGMITLLVCASAAKRTVPSVENCPSATTVEKALIHYTSATIATTEREKVNIHISIRNHTSMQIS